jgi:hypothetical protein
MRLDELPKSARIEDRRGVRVARGAASGIPEFDLKRKQRRQHVAWASLLRSSPTMPHAYTGDSISTAATTSWIRPKI